ncbi:MAG: type I glutamate--ammonia ligase [Alphaproteobacteria bacterium]|nr:type I glutamate--ammonia ligase [Alphaproteobacteria bacterium]OJV47912.1 MAG: type I glutamate--ammonia ligase [Alphaproteobacteria bacterium 43-37]
MKQVEKVLAYIAENDIKFVDLRLTGMDGKWHRLAYDVSQVDQSFLQNGVVFDGSSIRGWRDIHESDMRLIPDLERIVLDPFCAQPTAVLMADVVDPKTNKPYESDPRSLAKKAEALLAELNIADRAYFGPEPEFFVFDHVSYDVSIGKASYEVFSQEMSLSSGIGSVFQPNAGHRPGTKGGYFDVAPSDQCGDMRGEMLDMLKMMGVSVEKHHHEVAAAQHELGFKFDQLVQTGDHLQAFKYVVKNVAHMYGKSATFMPKPIFGDNGSGMHVHLSLWHKDKPLFQGNGYAGLSDLALHFVGGVLKHAKAVNAFSNPTTNSYKRLVPGYEAPVIAAYSQANRSVACRIPVVTNPQHARVEFRFPDPSANPYLALAAILMAGIDGIVNKIHPGKPAEDNLYERPGEYPCLCGSLEEALASLASDCEFLFRGDVFTPDMVQSYIRMKKEEVMAVALQPHPSEYALYYGV